MMAAWMVYAVGVGFLVALAAHALDRGARANGVQTRRIWLTALVFAALLPVALPASRDAFIAEPSGGVAVGAAQSAAGPIATAGAGRPLMDELTEIAARIERPLLLAWAALSVLLIGRVAWAMIALWRQRSQWIAREIDGVSLYVTPDLGPAVVAMPDSHILVPEWILALDEKALALVVRHEREHREAGDARLLVAGAIGAALLPWNPAIWLLRRRLRLAVEMDCDARVLRRDPHVGHYGELLLAIAQRPRLAPRLAVALTESTSDLERRIEAMTSQPPRAPRARAAALVLTAAGAIALACAMPAPDVVAPKVEEVPAAGGQVFHDFQVEQPVSAHPNNMPPRYPNQLRAANVEGSVTAEFVVDTNGRADMSTFKVLRSDHELFTSSVRDAVATLRFFPAQVGGRNIKQHVTMPFAFSLAPGERRAPSTNSPPRPEARVLDEVSATVDRAKVVVDAMARVTDVIPVYPAQLRAANIEGKVVASFIALPDGSVDMSSVRIEMSDHQLFDKSVRTALASMKVKPAAGKAGERITMPFVFSLKR